MCSAFSFEMTSGNIPFMQNNTSFSCYFGKSGEILSLDNQMNTLGINIQERNPNKTFFKSKVKEVRQYRDLKNNYIEG